MAYADPFTLQSVRILGEIGAPASAAIPSLIKLLDLSRDDRQFREQVASAVLEALGEIGAPEARALLLKMAEDESQDLSVVRAAARGLAQMETGLEDLTKLLRSKSVLVRSSAVEGLSAAGAKAVAPLAEILEKNNDMSLRTEAARGLQRIGPQATEAVPTLVKIAKQRSTGNAQTQVIALRQAVLTALAAISPQEAVPVCSEIIKQCRQRKDNGEVGIAAIERLKELGPASKDAVPELIELLKLKGFGRYDLVVQTLGQIGPEAKDALPALNDFAKSNPGMQELVTQAIAMIEGK
jgi:HEAT repeat protein